MDGRITSIKKGNENGIGRYTLYYRFSMRVEGCVEGASEERTITVNSPRPRDDAVTRSHTHTVHYFLYFDWATLHHHASWMRVCSVSCASDRRTESLTPLPLGPHPLGAVPQGCAAPTGHGPVHTEYTPPPPLGAKRRPLEVTNRPPRSGSGAATLLHLPSETNSGTGFGSGVFLGSSWHISSATSATLSVLSAHSSATEMRGPHSPSAWLG